MKARLWSLIAAAGLSAFSARAEGDSVVVINEIHYNPTANPALEYVELRNQLSVNVDLSGWRFDGGIDFDFPEGTVIPARGYLVVAKDPAALQAATGFANALGPFTGSLANDGETLTLYNNGPGLRTRPGTQTQPPANQLWSVDIQGNGAGGAFGQTVPVLMSGAEPVSGMGNVWNALTIAGHSGTTVNPALAALVDSAGTTTGVGFAITGTVSGFSSAGNVLTNDYLFLNAGNSAASITWRITGLDPAKTYGLWIYGSAARSIRIKADANGNGLLTDDTATTAAGGGALITGLHPDATGKIIGNADAPSGESNWGGFQLFVEQNGGATFDPGTFSTSLDRRRLMEEVDYGDSGAWPFALDGRDESGEHAPLFQLPATHDAAERRHRVGHAWRGEQRRRAEHRSDRERPRPFASPPERLRGGHRFGDVERSGWRRERVAFPTREQRCVDKYRDDVGCGRTLQREHSWTNDGRARAVLSAGHG